MLFSVEDSKAEEAPFEAEAAPADNATGEGAFDTTAARDEAAAFTETNVQVQGVDESDIVKTDGKNLFVCSGDTVSLVSTGETMALQSQIHLPEEVYASDMYLDGSKLVVLGHTWHWRSTPAPLEEERLDDLAFGGNQVWVGIYDVSNPAAPRLVRENAFEGYLSNSRKVKGILYLVVDQYTGCRPYLPTYDENGATRNVQATDLTALTEEYPENLTLVCAVDLRDSSVPATVKGFVGQSSRTLYMTQTALYLAGQTWNWEKGTAKTPLLKIAIDGQNIGYAASGEVPGYLLNQFSLDEYQGNLRVATSNDDGNHLFILDEGLNQLGSVKNLAPGERIYAVRYLGSMAYVVTFVETDPLFCIDLSDPANPVVKGELKLPGFSSYLHPVDENLLLGIGYDTETLYAEDRYGNRVTTGVRTAGLKLSLFDVTDPAHPAETDEVVLGGCGTYAEVTDDHKALMVDRANHRFGFGMNLCEYGKDGADDTYTEGPVLVTIADKTLHVTGPAELPEETDYTGNYLNRMVTVGDTVYYLRWNTVYAYNAGLSLQGTLSLTQN